MGISGHYDATSPR